MRSKRNPIRNIMFILIFVLLTVYAISLIFTMFWTVYSSLKTSRDFLFYPFNLPKEYRFQNYAEIMKSMRVRVEDKKLVYYVYIWEMLYNSVVFTVGLALLNVVVPSLTAYIVSKYRFRGRKLIYNIAIITMILPIIGALPSSLRVMETLNLRYNLFGVWFMAAGGFGFNFLILYSTFNSLSWNYGEAAFIDGAGNFRVYATIMMPLIFPTLSALFILSFIGNWNDFMTPLIYLRNFPTISYGIFVFEYEATTLGFTVPHVLAGFIIAMLPIIAIFLMFQNTIMSNVTAGGLKG